MQTLESIIHQAWDARETLTPQSQGPFIDAITEVIDLLDCGEERIAQKIDNTWHVHAWLKKAVLLSFRIRENGYFDHNLPAFDKVPLKFQEWQEEDFKKAGFRVVPGTIVRKGSYIAKDVVLMPSFVNIGAYVGEKTMIDSYATVGSCAQIGKGCHISSAAVIGGVLEPVQGLPVIIEDNVFVGAHASVVEGVVLEEGSVIAMGVQLGQSTPILNRKTGAITYGRIPAYSVVVPGVLPFESGEKSVQTSCAVIVKQVTQETRARTEINELLRA